MHPIFGGTMKSSSVLFGVALLAAGCTAPAKKELTTESTLGLCRIVVESKDQDYQKKAFALLTKRGANADKCVRLIQADNSVATGIAISGAAVATGAIIANNGGYGGGYYAQPSAYGVAWDQFYNHNYQLIWRCRDKATGRFVDDYYCASQPKIDATWPGWSA